MPQLRKVTQQSPRKRDEPDTLLTRKWRLARTIVQKGFGTLGFFRYFRPILGFSKQVNGLCGCVRGVVFGEMLKWEPVDEDGLEQDEKDSHSVCILLGRRGLGTIHDHENVDSKTRGFLVGCIRLIFSDPSDRMKPFPTEAHGFVWHESHKHALHGFQTALASSEERATIAEVSRLALWPGYQQRETDRKNSNKGPPSRSLSSEFIQIGLYLSMLAVAKKEGIRHLIFMIEPSLQRKLERLGVRLTRIGDSIDHRGLRHPFYLHVGNVLDGLPKWVRPAWFLISLQISREYRENKGATLRETWNL